MHLTSTIGKAPGILRFMMEHDIQRFYRDYMVPEIGEGTSRIQRNTIARRFGL